MARPPRSICRAKLSRSRASSNRPPRRRSRLWLRTLPDMGHAPEDYGDGADEHGVPPGTYQALERHLPRRLRAAPRDRKLAVMRRILQGLYPLRDVDMKQNPLFYDRLYRESISSYQPLYREIYNMNPSTFFVPSFLQAIRSNNEAGFRSIMAEPAPGLFVFSMLQPAFCQMLKAEVDHFQHHLRYARNQRMMVTTTIGENKYGVDLSDFGLETKLDNLLKDFLSPIATVLFPELGASSLDSHQSFVTAFAKDQGEGFHIDDSEVTLNVCINEEYIGGDMYFCGVRCMNHINSSEPRNQENILHFQTLGRAMLYRGRHRHGTFPTTSGRRITFEMWCRRLILLAGVASAEVKKIEGPGKRHSGKVHPARIEEIALGCVHR